MSLDPSGAAEALAAAQESRRRFAVAQAHWPWGRHAAFAALLGGLAAVQGLPLPFNVLGDLGLMFGALGLVKQDRRRRGVFVNGWRHGRTLWVSLLTMLLATAAGLVGLWFSRDAGLGWAPLAAGAVLLPVGLGASKLWEHVYRRELQESL